MSRAKELYEQQGEQGWNFVGSRYVCDEDFSDTAVKRFVANNAEERTCDYCGRSADHPIAAPVDDVFELLNESYAFEWGGPNDEGVAWDEGEWVGHVFDTDELLAESEDPFEKDAVRDEFLRSFAERQWCQREFYALPRHEALMSGWRHFTEFVMHKRRYLFLSAPRRKWPDIGPGEVEPPDMLEEIGKVYREVGRISVLPPGTSFFRARCHEPDKVPGNANNLGPPPDEKAQTNRMTPAGISIFSGARDQATAIAEVVSVPDNAKYRRVTVGEFRSASESIFIDLTDLPDVPSLFDREDRQKRPAIRFLREFARDLSRPIRRDGREHVDYVPTQVVAEYFRLAYKTEDGRSADGILYPSAQVASGVNSALFFDRSSYCDKSADWAKDKTKRLALERFSTQPNPAHRIAIRRALRWLLLRLRRKRR